MNEKLECLYQTYGQDNIDNLFKEYQFDLNSNFLLSHAEALKSQLSDFNILKKFVEFYTKQKGKNINESCKSSLLMALLKEFKTNEIVENNSKQEIEMFEDEEESKDDTSGISSNQLEKITDDLNEIKESVNLLHQDQTDVRIFETVSGMKKMLDDQVNTKTEKKSTYNQVKELDLKTDESLKEIKEIKKILPKNIGIFYSAKDMNKNLFFGMGIAVVIFIILIVSIGIVAYIFS